MIIPLISVEGSGPGGIVVVLYLQVGSGPVGSLWSARDVTAQLAVHIYIVRVVKRTEHDDEMGPAKPRA